ncbi:MAG: hypothetical protein ACSLFI_12365 [Solirubrobacterales bacterium]
MEKTKKNRVTKGVTTDRIPKLFGAGVLVASLVAGAGNVEALGLTTAGYAAAEVTRSLLTVRSFGPSASSSGNTTVKPVAGHTH